MGKRTSYEPGTFSWVELSTTDPDGAKAFYGELFGWKADDQPIPGGGIYSMMRLGGESVAAIQQKPEQQAALPPYWFNYITVASADETAATAKEAGGQVHMAPFDVMEAGRMTVIMDPTGAAFGIWEPRDHIGATLVNDHGTLTWNELSTNDVASAIEFYERLFGWNVEPLDTAGGPPYWSIQHEDGAGGRNGGMRELAPEQVEAGIPPHWMPYFDAAPADEAVAKTTELGGAAMFGPVDLPNGQRFAVLRDPQGAIFAIAQGEADD
jgi:uncharacterized protein